MPHAAIEIGTTLALRERPMARYKTGKITTRLVEGLAPGEIVSDSRLPGYGVRRQLDARVYFVRKYCQWPAPLSEPR